MMNEPPAVTLRIAPASHDDGATSPAAPAPSRACLFVEVADSVGLCFRHEAGRSLDYYFPEIVGSGAALFDYDGDGDLDVYLVQGHSWTADGVSSSPAVTDRLFRNELTAGDPGSLRFVDVTDQSGLSAGGYGMGVTAGDFNNDGHTDLYVTNFGPNQLWLNRGNGTFRDATAEWNAGDDRWSTSAAAVDFDHDGWLDLYVVNYVDFTFAGHKSCYDSTTIRDYCGPVSYNPQPDRLLRNRGDGRFDDVTATAGIGSAYGAGLGVVCADFDGNGAVDLYVANDGMANQCWSNDGQGRFCDTALLAGCAFNEMGEAEAGMGVDAADIDDDGDEDLFLAHLTGETNTAYLNQGSGFEDATGRLRLAGCSRAATAFGAGWLDFDNDGALDVFTVNGAVKRGTSSRHLNEPYPPGQPNQLFRNLGKCRFVDVSDQMPAAFLAELLSRGAAVGDLDNDGDADLLVCNNDEPVQLFLNQAAPEHHWIGLQLIDPISQRDQLGGVVTLTLRDGRRLRRHAHTDGSYCSSRDPRVLIGLGTEDRYRDLTVLWPDGRQERFRPPVDDYSTLTAGEGEEVGQ